MSSMIPTTVRSVDITSMFPEIKGNLTKITWAHAVNTRKQLEEVMSSDIMMIEADIILGTTPNNPSDKRIPVMGHPPSELSDLSFEEFFQTVEDYNRKGNVQRKGIKLDYKSIDAYQKSVQTILGSYHKINYPVWINADILPGPVNSTATPIDPQRFFEYSKYFTNSTLSVGWTTRYGEEVTNASYSASHVDAMLNILQQYKVSQPVTFPVRAGIAAESIQQMQRLVDSVSESTLTIWSHATDPVDIAHLESLIETVGLERVFLDVPDELMSQLRLDRISSVNRLRRFTAASLMVASLVHLL